MLFCEDDHGQVDGALRRGANDALDAHDVREREVLRDLKLRLENNEVTAKNTQCKR